MTNSEPIFRVSRDEFADAVGWVARMLPQRPSVPVLAGILISVDSGVTLTGFDHEKSAKIDISGEVSEPGNFLVHGRLLNEITRTLPQEPVEIEISSMKMNLSCGNSKFTLSLMPVEDYPQLPQLPVVTGTVNVGEFSQAITQVAVASGKDDTLPMLTGIQAEISREKLTLIATDRFRLAIKELPWETNLELQDSSILIPAKTLTEVVKGSTPGKLDLAFGSAEELANGKEGVIGIEGAGRTSTTRLLDADFPKVRQLLPDSHKSVALVDVDALIASLKRIAVVAERGIQVRLSFTEDQVVISAGGDDIASGSDVLGIQFAGEPLTIAFNPGYLQEGLSALGGSHVVFGFADSSRPAVLREGGDQLPEADESGSFPAIESDYTYLLMPVRLPG